MLAVVGCHRSGTSAVAGALACLGWHLGPDLMPPSPDNPKGYYESMPLVRLHDAALARMGHSWDAAVPVSEGWLTTFGAKQAHVRARLLLQRCIDGAKSNALALKDPRLCMFRLLWQEACKAEGIELRALLVYRDQHSVVQSLCSRDRFTVEHAKAVVEHHRMGMVDWLAHVPSAVVQYEDLLDDWREALGEAFEQLGLPTLAYADEQGAVDAYLNPELDHYGDS
jgi:hypothetical protein